MKYFKSFLLLVFALLLTTGLPLQAQNDKSWKADQDIVTLASENDNFSTLVVAIEKAGLIETLRGEGPFTVFAPLNSAFKNLPEVKLNTWLQPGMEDALGYVLKYHVLAGKYTAEDVLSAIRAGNGSATFKTVAGEKLTAVLAGNAVALIDPDGDRVEIEMTDVMASNGVIHAIDGVLTPKTYTESNSVGVSPVGNMPGETAVPSVADWAVKTESLQNLTTALKAADLVAPLADEDNLYTVFAPVNEAFAAIPEKKLSQLLQPKNQDKLRSLLSYHVIGGTYSATDLFEMIEDGNGTAELTTLTDQVLTLTVNDGNLFVSDVRGNQVKVNEINVPASNGVIYLIDGVLMNKAGKARGKMKGKYKKKKSDW